MWLPGEVCSLLNILQLLCFIVGIAHGRLELNGNDISKWVTTISTDLGNFRMTVLGADNIETNYRANGVSAATVADTQASQVLQIVKNRIQALMWKRENQVETIRTQAEQLFADYAAKNYSCSDFTGPPYKRATAVVKLDTASPTATPARASGIDYCSQNAMLDLRPDSVLLDVETDRSSSTSHVPQYIYDASNDILNVANWTSGLEFVMNQSAVADPTLMWQYFGSRQGLLKMFPGVRWSPQASKTATTGLTMDPYDCRSQNWYLLSATYPKDLVLVIDNSGSMKGSGSIMANRTLTEFLATLTANDYFNVLLAMGTATSSVSYVTELHNGTLLQATDANKNKMMELLNEDRLKSSTASRSLQAQGLADLGAALTEALQLLRLVKENKTEFSAGGVQAIAMVTDSSPEDYAAVFAKYNPGRQVRLFTFLMGQEASDAPVVKSMACANRGFFSQVSTMSDAKESASRYIPVMSRPNSQSRHRFFTWSDVHKNQIITVGMSDNAKNALFTSVSQAAYNTRLNSTEPVSIIGVAGVDVSVDNIDRLGPAWQLGPLAYIFVVNNNGFVIYHPELRTVDSSGNPLLFYNSRDIANVEVPADATPLYNEPDYNLSLRTALVQRQTGTFEFARIRLYDDNSRSQRVPYRYLTTPLISSEVAGSSSSRQTPFSLGLALPWLSGRQWPQPPAYTFSASLTGANLTGAEIGALLSIGLVQVATVGNASACQQPLLLQVGLGDYEFCDFSPALRPVYNASTVCAAAQVLTMSRSAQAAMSCSIEFLDRLRVDAASSQGAPAVWRAALANASVSAPARLLGASGGHVFLWSGGSGLARWLVDPALNGSLSTPRWQNGSRDQLYERTVAMATENANLGVALTPPSSIVVAAAAASNATYPRAFPVFLTAPIRVAAGSVAAVAGAELDYARLETYFTSATNSCAGAAPCTTCAQASINCYLLDLNGIVVASKQREDVGKTFDWVNCDAMEAMISQGLFYGVQSYDYQSVCYRKLAISSSASSLFSPIRALLRLVSRILLEGYLILSDLTTILFGGLSAEAQMTNSSLYTTIVYASRTTIGCQSYSLLQANSIGLAAGLRQLANITCSLAFSSATFAKACISDIYVKQVDNTNLVFVAVAQDSGCQCQGCSPRTGAKEMATPVNYSLPQAIRSKPDWTRSNITLTDNSTICANHASRVQASSLVPLFYWFLLACVQAFWRS